MNVHFCFRFVFGRSLNGISFSSAFLFKVENEKCISVGLYTSQKVLVLRCKVLFLNIGLNFKDLVLVIGLEIKVLVLKKKLLITSLSEGKTRVFQDVTWLTCETLTHPHKFVIERPAGVRPNM